ncbi:Uncharacterised protein [uncultured archaeon]|nr:Uncharacterised protein [uncultured archaeon]
MRCILQKSAGKRIYGMFLFKDAKVYNKYKGVKNEI